MNLQSICMKLPPAAHLMLWAGFLIWEYGLSKTSFGSTLGLMVETPIQKLTLFIQTGSFKAPSA